jgi:hypothetical protein
MRSACNASGGVICGSDCGQRGSVKGCVLLGSSSVAPLMSRVFSRNRRPSKGRNAGFNTMVFAVKTSRPVAQGCVAVATQLESSARGIAKRTPCNVMGPDTGPCACCQVNVVPDGRRATICRSSRSRPPIVVSNHHAKTTTITTNASAPSVERNAMRRARVRRATLRAARCSGVSGASFTSPRRCSGPA